MTPLPAAANQIIDTLYVVYPNGERVYEPLPAGYLEDYPEGTKFYLSEYNWLYFPGLDLAELV